MRSPLDLPGDRKPSADDTLLAACGKRGGRRDGRNPIQVGI
jgi:hypothetical protein